ncbi:MAG: glucose-6-phosphate dehydrogenase assembly protein OpcA [Mycobacteriales bacterium]|nr:MAG: glucose-6-phosphate dehydrogenase [Pseudonocardiales bacterium]
MTTLWDTTGSDVVHALAAERRTGGSITSGSALTLLVVVGERNVAQAEAAATTAASHHPCRLLVVVRREVDASVPRLDAEVLIGGRLGPGEAVVMRMYGRLGLHAESVALPLLAPDVPVVTWWYGPPPDQIAHDPLGVLADHRLTDCSIAADAEAGLLRRADDYAPGDSDLAWTRITPWRIHLAAAVDSCTERICAAVVHGEPGNPSARLLAGWLQSRLGCTVRVEAVDGGAGAIADVSLEVDGDGTLALRRVSGGQAVLERSGQTDSQIPMPDRELGELLAEELRRIDVDEVYGEALEAATGRSGLADRSPNRTHIWRDPALQQAADRPTAAEAEAASRP